MRLTLHADYALRVLLYLGTHPDRAISNQEIGKAYGISKHHLVRVVERLNAQGFVKVSPGRFGGASLAADPQDINIGAVVRATETNLAIVECFDMETNTCVIAPVCRLKGVLQSALGGFLSVLDRYTLADLLPTGTSRGMAHLFAARKSAAV